MASSKTMRRLAQATVKQGESLLQQNTPKYPQLRIAQRTFHSSAWLAEDKKPSKDDDPVNFRLSLYQSTFDRIQRERADNERFAKLRTKHDTDKIGVTVSLILCTPT